MKNAHVVGIVIAMAFLVACGNGNPKLNAMMVSPSAVQASSSVRQQVAFTATGQFDNGASRALSGADGVQWASSDNRVATISGAGVATCLSPGSVAIMASAPSVPPKIVGTPGSPAISSTLFVGGKPVPGPGVVSGTASLTCA